MTQRVAGLRGGREAEILDMIKALSPDELRSLARKLDRSTMTPTVLSWISAQRCIDLGTAMTMFMNADPNTFNHVEKESVPEIYRRLCASLDALCQRINCGYYLPDPKSPMDRPRDFSLWMKNQEADARSRRKGRWIFNAVVVAPMTSDIRFDSRRHQDKPVKADKAKVGIFRKVISPLMA